MLANGHLFKTKLAQPAAALLSEKPYYTTEMGAAVLGDSLEVMRQMPDASVNLVVTSPPYALHFKKEYGNADQGK